MILPHDALLVLLPIARSIIETFHDDVHKHKYIECGHLMASKPIHMQFFLIHTHKIATIATSHVHLLHP